MFLAPLSWHAPSLRRWRHAIRTPYDILAVTVNALFLIARAVVLVDRHLEEQLGWTRALTKSKLKEAVAVSPEDGDPTATRLGGARAR